MHTDLPTSTQPSLAIAALLLLGSTDLLGLQGSAQELASTTTRKPRTLKLTPAKETGRLAA